jgi:nucleoid-associated protein YgaU
MKNWMSRILLVMIAGIMVSCSSAPTKELEEAKAAIERADAVDAESYAKTDIGDAKEDYKQANLFVEASKNDEAKQKAISSKDKAIAAYGIAVENRAKDYYEKDKTLMGQAEENFAPVLRADDFAKAKGDFVKLETQIAAKAFEAAYTNGFALYKLLTNIVADCMSQTEKAKNAINKAQNEYDVAQNSQIVVKYALDDLKMALAPLEEARKLYQDAKLAESIKKAEEALALIQAAKDKAQAAYEADLKKQQQDYEQFQLQREQELKAEKAKAEEYMKKAKQMLDKLKEQEAKKNKSGSMLENGVNKIVLESGTIMYLGQVFKKVEDTKYIAPQATNSVQNGSSDSDETLEAVPDEEVTIELVEKYYKLAEDAYAKGEFLDAIDYAREAMRLAEILMNKQEGQTYTVVLNPKDRDCLWKIAARMYDKNAWMWPIIWKANTDQIKDPDLIYPGQVFKIPPSIIK